MSPKVSDSLSDSFAIVFGNVEVTRMNTRGVNNGMRKFTISHR